MKVITFSKRVTVSTTTGGPNGHLATVLCNPGERLLFNDDSAQSIELNQGNAYLHEVTDYGPLAPIPIPLRKWPGHRILFYRPRGIGDQLICSALSRYARQFLGAEAYQLCDKVYEPLWASNSYIVWCVMRCALAAMAR